MENSRLPIEVCERVIDECSDFYERNRRKTLRACALTCSQWLPRSQYNLYQEVHWLDQNSAKILDTFSARPELAGYVRAIDIDIQKYAPLTQVLSLPSLKKCQRLKIDMYWDKFPPRYVQNCLVPLLTKFESVVELNFTAWSAASAVGFFHIIWTMPQLLSCELEYEEQCTPTAASLANLERTALRMQPRLCLQNLVFHGIEAKDMPHIQGYPPQRAFGSLTNLTKFEFEFLTAAAVSNSFLQFLGEMVSLEELKMRIWFDNDELEGADLLAQVLRCVQSSHLKKCEITLVLIDEYGCTRDGLLNIISGEAVQQCLQKLLFISEFIITLDENHATFDEDWWTTEITKKLPALKDTLTVHVLLLDNVGKLWMEDLPAEAASSIDTENNMHITSELDELSGLSEDPYSEIQQEQP